MTDCAKTSALLEVYADAEASPETNALVQRHLRNCASCLRELNDIRNMKTQLREVFGRERAPAAVVTRIRSAIDARQPRRFAAALRDWLAPASAAAVALAVWTFLPSVPSSLTEAAIAEHVACALDRRTMPLDAATAVNRGYIGAMPWIRDQAHAIHVVDAHACGESPLFAHVIVSVSGTIASVLIAPRARGGDAPLASLRRGDFDVSVVSAGTHNGYLIGPREPSAVLGDWRSPVLDRITRFLQQLEGTL